MRKIISCICFSISFLVAHSQTNSKSKDTIRPLLNTDGNWYESKSSKPNGQVDSNDHVQVRREIGLSKDTLKVKLNSEMNRYESTTPILKIPTDLDVHYHILHKEMNVNYSIPIPNSLNNARPLEPTAVPKFRKDTMSRGIPKLEFLQDSLIMHRLDSPLKRRIDMDGQ
jgi:hypothetical protein